VGWLGLSTHTHYVPCLVVFETANDRDKNFEKAGTGTGMGQFWPGPGFFAQFDIGRDWSNLI